jgi:hypothetical protein
VRRKKMSEQLVRSVLKEYIEGDMPERKDPWTAIEARLTQAKTDGGGSTASAFTPSQPRTERTAALPGGRGLRVNVNAAMALVALLTVVGVIWMLAVSNRPDVNITHTPAAPPSGEFLPAGWVRHMVLTGTLTIDGSALGGPVETTEQHHEEFWLAQGQSHPLMRDVVTVPISATNWLDDNGYYEYEPAKGDQITWSAYDPQVLPLILPDPGIFTKTMQMPNARLVGEDTLDGRSVTVIEVPGSTPAQGTPSAKDGLVHKDSVTTYWIDRQTSQLLQVSGVITTVGGSQNGLVSRTLNKTAVDELLPRDSFPADFFTSGVPGVTMPFGSQTPTMSVPGAP